MLKIPGLKDKRTETEKCIDDKIESLAKATDTSESVDDVLELMVKRRDLNKKDRIKPDTIALIAGNIGGLLLVLHYERFNVVASKALQFVIKGGRV